MPVPGIGKIFQSARFLGDTSSLTGGGTAGALARIQNRAVGRGTSKLMQMNVFGLIMWAEFFGFLNTAVQAAAAKDVWVGTFTPYAAGYEFGFRNPVGKRRRRPYFFQAVEQAAMEAKFGRSRSGRGASLSVSRSGVYVGGRFFADIRAVARGSVVQRGARRVAGREISRFFWGTLKNPNRNVNHAIANRIITLSRRAARSDNLVDTGALVMSIQQADSLSGLRAKSILNAIQRSGQSGTKFTGRTRRALP